jgi:hypothetical protein
MKLCGQHAKAGKVAHSLSLAEITICKAEGINGQSFSFALRCADGFSLIAVIIINNNFHSDHVSCACVCVVARRKSKETFFLASEKEQEMVEWIRLMAVRALLSI